MKPPIPAESAEKIILYYIELKHLWLNKKISKLHYFLGLKAKELGMSLRSAQYLVKFAEDIGMIE